MRFVLSSRLLNVLASALTSVSLFLSTGCDSGDTGSSGETETETDPGEEAPEFEEGQGQAASEPQAAPAYPEGPFGIEVGSVVQNHRLYGFMAPDQDNDKPGIIQFSDFYNPTGEEVFPNDSPYAGEPKPKALVVIVAAVWCGPCNYEADEILPGEHAEWYPQGVQFLQALADGPDYGVPAKLSHLTSWTSKYDTAWPAAIDPGSDLGEFFDAAAFPANFIIDTRTMTLVETIAGVPDAAFWAKVTETIEG